MKNKYYFNSEKGLTEKAVEQISQRKNEPAWMRDFRKKSYTFFQKQPMPKIKGIDLSEINFGEVYSFMQPVEEMAENWSKLPSEIKQTYEKLHIPEWERKYLSGVSAQYESMVVYKKAKEELEKQGVIFVDMDQAVKEYSHLLKPYFGQIIKPCENKLMALNSAFWSGGVFIHVPKNVKVHLPLQSYFYINQKNLGQFERTLIVADEGSELTYLEGCSAPVYSSYVLHTGMVEIMVKKGAKVRFVTVQNWSKNVYNFSIKRAIVEEKGFIDWTMASIGSKVTVSYPTSILKGKSSRAKYLSLSVASNGQSLNTGARVVHAASDTTCEIVSKSLGLKGGQSIFNGLIRVPNNVKNTKSFMACHSLLLDNKSKSLSYPGLEVETNDAKVSHEASFGGLSEEQLFYLKSRGLKESQAISLLVNGFVNPVIKDLPPDYLIELRRLLELEVEGN